MARPTIEIRVAGPIRVLRSDGTDLTPAAAKVRGLLLLLAMAPGLRRSRAWLQDRLWSDRAPEQASSSMRQALTELRSALADDRDCLLTGNGWVGFDRDRVVVQDRPRSVGISGDMPELAEGLEVPDPEFEDWIRDQRLAFEDRLAGTAPPVDVPDPRRRRRRRPWVVLVSAAALIVLVALWAGARQIDFSALLGDDRSIPSIAVLPFQNFGSDPSSEMLVNGISRDIVTDLSRFGDLFVIAADSSFRFDPSVDAPQSVGQNLSVRYVLEGSVQWFPESVRINAQVVETETARSVWAERFELPRDDLLQLQNEVVQHVVDVIGPVDAARGKLRDTELRRVGRLPTDSLRAYDHYLQGVLRFDEFTSEGNAAARVAFSRASTLDPRYAKAYAMEAWTYLSDYWDGRAEVPAAALAQAEALAERALSVDPSEPYSHWALGAVRLFQKRHELAVASYRRAIELNPNGADLMVYLGWALVYAGEPSEGLAHMEQAIERNPYHPGWYLWDLAFGHFVGEDYESAVETLERRNPKTAGTWQLLAASYAMLGREEEARAAMDRVMALAPFAIADLAEVEPFARQSDLDRYLDALRLAGAPEESARSHATPRADEGGLPR